MPICTGIQNLRLVCACIHNVKKNISKSPRLGLSRRVLAATVKAVQENPWAISSSRVGGGVRVENHPITELHACSEHWCVCVCVCVCVRACD